MSWHLQVTPGGTVGALLNQIQAQITQCNLLLAQVASHRSRCQSCSPGDVTHRDGAFHGPQGAQQRMDAAQNLVNVLAALQSVQAELVLCSTEMSHGGNP